jgi:hypothetical protein
MQRLTDIWEQPGLQSAAPFLGGWLNSSLPLYGNTHYLKSQGHTRPLGQRPCLDLEPTDHPLAVELRTGITMTRVRDIAERLSHGKVRA